MKLGRSRVFVVRQTSTLSLLCRVGVGTEQQQHSSTAAGISKEGRSPPLPETRRPHPTRMTDPAWLRRFLCSSTSPPNPAPSPSCVLRRAASCPPWCCYFYCPLLPSTCARACVPPPPRRSDRRASSSRERAGRDRGLAARRRPRGTSGSRTRANGRRRRRSCAPRGRWGLVGVGWGAVQGVWGSRESV